MPPQLALLLTTAFVVFLFLRDRRESTRVSGRLWIPLIWLLIIGSRNVSEWVGFGGGESLAEGSPLDSTIYFALEIVGLAVLLHRRVSLSEFLSRNPWFTLFFAYGALSI